MEKQKFNETHSAGEGRQRPPEELKTIKKQEAVAKEERKAEEETLSTLNKVAEPDIKQPVQEADFANPSQVHSVSENDDTVGNVAKAPAGQKGPASKAKAKDGE